MKKVINYSLGLFLMATVLSACTSYLDINYDPNYPASASTPLLFSSGTTWSAIIWQIVTLTFHVIGLPSILVLYPISNW